jgi:Ran GTPase-activating protein (RanGAP) involved in mRNA processing and transport
VTDTGLRALLAAPARTLQSLSSLELVDCNINGTGLDLLPSFVKRRDKLRFLSFSRNAIGQEAGRALAATIREGVLGGLHLGFNELERGVVYIAEALGQGGTGLELLNLDANLISESHLAAFANAISARDSGLSSLSLSHNQIGDFGMHWIGRVLQSTGLRTLNLESNEIGDSGLELLRDSVRGSHHLQHLFLDRNNIGEKGAFTIAGWLPRNGALRTLSLRYNAITNYGAKKLQQALAANGHVTELLLDGNVITDAGTLDAIEALLNRNRRGAGPKSEDGGWSEWGACEASCGHGMQRRWCSRPKPQGFGKGCAGADDDSEPQFRQCYAGECPGAYFAVSMQLTLVG